MAGREPNLKTIWGIAKSQDLKLTDEELHLVVSAHTGKDSLRQLTKREMNTVVQVLVAMRDSSRRKERGNTKIRGNTATENQRKKIYCLAKDLGWDKPARVNGMCMKMFGVSSVEWLGYQQCAKLIEALKSMVERKEKQDGGVQANSDSQG